MSETSIGKQQDEANSVKRIDLFPYTVLSGRLLSYTEKQQTAIIVWNKIENNPCYCRAARDFVGLVYDVLQSLVLHAKIKNMSGAEFLGI